MKPAINQAVIGIGKMEYCCLIMTSQMNHECSQHPLNTCPDIIVILDKEQEEYLLKGKNADYVCWFCPWCGKDLRK